MCHTNSNLQYLTKLLSHRQSTLEGDFFIPEVWNSFGYKDFTTHAERPGEISVNPYKFTKHCIKTILANPSSLSIPLKDSIIYGILPRMFTSWDHYSKDNLCPGTFLKCLWLLPYLKKMNINIVYLLPIFKISDKYKKGDVGCPYAIKDIYKLDDSLHDSLLGEYNFELLELQFKAFVEACHALGIKVMLDFAFRTVARDNVLTETHPEWFYWIDKKYEKNFEAPKIPELPPHTSVSLGVIDAIYKSKSVKEYLTMFTEYDPENPNITTAPAFSDVINDTQPIWSDITYLKFYFDASYILYDGIKLNVFSGKKPNAELWDYIKKVIPYYQNKFNIDGARIDMGHALPPDLSSKIIAASREGRKDFILWSEVIDIKLSGEAKKQGYDLISGDLWAAYKYPCIDCIAHTASSKLPLIASPETPDTPRLALQGLNKQQIKKLLDINFSLPNSIPFINNGMDVLEVQPMNLGLGNTEEGRFVLDKSDPQYGKLAFFDNYRLHWLNKNAKWMFDTLCEISSSKKEL